MRVGLRRVVAPHGGTRLRSIAAVARALRSGSRGWTRKVIFDGAGHGMWFQDMERFVNLVVRYLQPAKR